MPHDSILSLLRGLECELHGQGTRLNPRRLAELLHPDFQEFGRSGAVYSRTGILELMAAESQPATVHAQDFRLQELAPSVALLTYRSAHVTASDSLERPTNRSSIWRLDDAGWRMAFHQGTPTEPFQRCAT